MKLATVRTPSGTAAVRLEADDAVHLGAGDVGALLGDPEWRERAASAAGERFAVEGLDYAPLVPHPEKIVCVGLNYRNHIEEMGRQLPTHPTLFAKYPPALIGARDDIVLPRVSEQMDWEAELAIVIGSPVRAADERAARAAIAGYTILDDVTARDWQNRTLQWLQGKSFEASTPLGPALVTADEVDAEAGLRISASVNGEVVQDDTTAQLLFGPVELVRYLSTFITLHPGDVIATGTPGGVGHGRTPPRYLRDGDVLVTAIEGLGECRNTCRSEANGTRP
ncbi:MAG TPA: fumarylacetoacetate hydrolase family protein [Acidimicrobiales bacterium]|nr:fumarylacetoacetate hydrolase family protein [Acidimicrobiales bacterium]